MGSLAVKPDIVGVARWDCLCKNVSRWLSGRACQAPVCFDGSQDRGSG